MKNYRSKKEFNFNKNNNLLDNDLFSLRLTDSLYKKDIGKFLEYLSSHII